MDVNLSNSYRPRSACPCPGVRNSMPMSLASSSSQLQQPPNGRLPPHPPLNSSMMQQEYHFRAPNQSYNIPPSMPMSENMWPSFIPPRNSMSVYQNNPMVMQCNNTSNNNTPHQTPYSNGWNPRPSGASILQPIGNYEVPVTHWNHPVNNSGAYHHQNPHQHSQQQQHQHHNIISNCSGPPSGRQQQQQQPLSQGTGIMGNVHSQGLSGRPVNNSMNNNNNNPHMHGNSMMMNSQMRSSGISNNRIQPGKTNNHITVNNNNNNNNSNIGPPRQSQSNFQASYSHRGGNHNNQGRNNNNNNNHHSNNNHGNHNKMLGGANMNRNGNSRHRFDTPVSSVNSSTSTSSSNSHAGNPIKQTLPEKNGQQVNQPQSQSEIAQSQKFSSSSIKYSESKPSSAKTQVLTQPQEQKPMIPEPENLRVTSNPADEFFAASKNDDFLETDCYRLQEELLKPVKAIERTVSQNGRRRRRSSEKSLLFDRRPESQGLSTEKSQNTHINSTYSCKKKSAVIENMMKGLVHKRDTEQVIYMAQAFDQKEVYILAANYLETIWTLPSSTNKNIRELIIDFYSRADAKNALAAFLSKLPVQSRKHGFAEERHCPIGIDCGSKRSASIQRNGFGFRGWTFPREYSLSPVTLHHDEASINDAYDADESANESELEEFVRDNRNDKRINVTTSSISANNNNSSSIPFLQDLGSYRIQNSSSINYFMNPWRKI